MRTLVAFLLFALCACASAYTRDDYCKVCADHTMCKYTDVSANCKNGVFANGLTSADKESLVNLHNIVRNKVASGAETRGQPGPQPNASNMNRVKWNDNLAEVAQRLTDQCVYGHDTCRNLPGLSVGQNLFQSSSWPCSSTHNGRNWTAPVYAWYGEVEFWSKDNIDKYQFSTKTGHYTQLVWAQTTQIGCGYTLYEEDGWCNDYVACNYASAGNYIDQPLYKAGKQRTACSTSTTPDARYPALC